MSIDTGIKKERKLTDPTKSMPGLVPPPMAPPPSKKPFDSFDKARQHRQQRYNKKMGGGPVGVPER